MDNKLIETFLKCKERKNDLYRLHRAECRLLEDLRSKLTEELYGKVGDLIKHHHTDGKEVTAKILYFEPSLFSEIPICIVQYEIEGRKIEGHCHKTIEALEQQKYGSPEEEKTV